MTKDVCVLKDAKDTQEINSGGSYNNPMAYDFSTPQFHAINDGSSVFRNSIIYGVLESSLRVILYYILLCIRVLWFKKNNKAWILFEEHVDTLWSYGLKVLGIIYPEKIYSGYL